MGGVSSSGRIVLVLGDEELLVARAVEAAVAAVRDATIDEMGDLAQAMVALDQSYYIQPPLAVQVHTTGWGFGGFGFSGFGGYGVSGGSDSAFVDAYSFRDCNRVHMKVNEFPRRNPEEPNPVPMPQEAPAL